MLGHRLLVDPPPDDSGPRDSDGRALVAVVVGDEQEFVHTQGLDVWGFQPPAQCEGDGLSARWRDQADVPVRVPMRRGVDSLNVASAAAIACYLLAEPVR